MIRPGRLTLFTKTASLRRWIYGPSVWQLIEIMNRILALVLVSLGLAVSTRAQLLLSTGESYAFLFSDLSFFGDGYSASNPNGINFSTFYSDANGSTPGATFRVDLFENNVGEAVIATASGSGFVTAQANGGWHDRQGVALVTVTAGAVLFTEVLANVYVPTGFGDFELYSSGSVPVPEPGSITLGALGLLALAGWKLRKRQCGS